ncbi:MAG TPA: hypothetical protein VK652_08630 [Steroidobacteraceae bacterium]|nr:hypothetical protein [Steroidobacteraceae bacterium]
MKNLTPEHLRCVPATCPAVYELTDGRLLIVGKRAELPGMVGDDEYAVTIDCALLANVK